MMEYTIGLCLFVCLFVVVVVVFYFVCVFFLFFVLEMGQKAAESALGDAGLGYDQVQAVAVSYCYGDPTSGEPNKE